MKILSLLAVSIIRLYQRTLSPDHGWFRSNHPLGFCRYHPSCSEFAVRTIKKHGIFVGTLFVMRRIIKCNPWSRGGLDPVQ
ncbi:MAG: membrane protein insertion efficiency factor YidD [Candidatus Kerfeldbacteria bacterium]